MSVPLLDLSEQHRLIRHELDIALARVMDSQQYILGPEVETLENEVAQRCKVRFGVGVSSGSDALLVALMALDVGPGDEVITSTYTFFATAGAIARLGATVVFVDIEPHSFNLDPQATIDAMSERTKAIIPVHLFGRCADMNLVARTAKERGITVVEDAAQAMGGKTADGKPVGSVGDLTCHSFYPSKNLGGFGDGGMVVGDDRKLTDTVRLLRNHGADSTYSHRFVGGNFRLDALQASVLCAKLPHLDTFLEGRTTAAKRYRRLFAEYAAGLPIRLPDDVSGHSYNQFVIRAAHRDDLRVYLSKHGVGNAIYYPRPLHMQECFAHLGLGPGDLPVSEKAAEETLAIPIFPEINIDQQREVVEACVHFYGQMSGSA